MARLRPIMGSSVTLDAAEIGLRAAGYPNAAGALRSVRSRFGRSRRLQPLVAGGNVARQGRENSMVIIEEMKDGL